MEAIHYKGWIIIEETDPWAIKYGSNYRFFPEGEEGNGEVMRNSVTIEEAKDAVDFLSMDAPNEPGYYRANND